jgi:ankyrin repeat protein
MLQCLAAVSLVVLLALSGCGKAEAPPPTATEVSEFFNAVQDGDAEIVSRLLKAKPGLASAKNENGETALQVAESRGLDEVAEALRK